MKNILKIFLIGFMTVCLVACGEADKQEITDVIAENDVDNSEVSYETVIENEIIEGKNPLNVLPVTISVEKEYEVNVETGEKNLISTKCKKWDVKHKKFLGTCWKKVSSDTTEYIRIQGSTEFFSTDKSDMDKTDFSTSMICAYAVENEEEIVVHRMLFLHGTITSEGILTINTQIGHGETEDKDFVINEFEQITKEELPFSDDDYREITKADVKELNPIVITK